MDGELKNEWQVAGTGDNNTIEGAFIYGANYKYITLGGNQAFDWGDPDPGFMFDDFAVYNKELSLGTDQADYGRQEHWLCRLPSTSIPLKKEPEMQNRRFGQNSFSGRQRFRTNIPERSRL